MEQGEIKVGHGIIIFKDGKVLLGKRKGSHGAGEFAFPGGRLEYGESLYNSVIRETKEECGIEVENLEFYFLGNVKDYPPVHWVQIGFKADWKSGEPHVLELEKCESWNWYDLDKLPEPLFVPTKMLIDAYKNKVNFIDE